MINFDDLDKINESLINGLKVIKRESNKIKQSGREDISSEIDIIVQSGLKGLMNRDQSLIEKAEEMAKSFKDKAVEMDKKDKKNGDYGSAR